MNFRQLNESFDKMNKELLNEESYTPKVRRVQSVDGTGRTINQYYEEPDFENRAKGDRNVKEITDKQYNDFLMTGKLSEEVTPDNAFGELEDMIERYGADDILHELARAIGSYELSRSLEYIKRMYGEYDNVDESLKESADPLVIYKALGTYKVTPKSNYDSHISNARLVNDLRDFTSADEIMDYFIKYGFAQSKDDFIVLDEARGNYGHEGPFWYYTKHGIGPGTLPKDVQVVDIYEDDDFGTYVALDSVLTADELQEYELKEQTPPER